MLSFKDPRIVIIILVSTLSGVYLCVIVAKVFDFTLDGKIGFEINPFELLVLLTNIYLAIYITKTLGKEHDARKSEKELLINYFLEYKNDFSGRVSELSKQSDLMSITTNANFKVLRSRITTIIGLAKESNLISSDEKLLTEIPKKISEVWELFTDAPTFADERSSDGVKKEIERIRLEKISKIELNSIKIEKLIFQLILKVNNK